MDVEVLNPQGLHMRPCHMIVSTAMEFAANLEIHFQGRVVNGKSILELIGLNAPCGSKLRLASDGSDSDDLLAAIAKLFHDGFGEMSV